MLILLADLQASYQPQGCLTLEELGTALEQTGFSEENVVLHDTQDPACRAFSVVITGTAHPSSDATGSTSADVPGRNLVLIHADDDAHQESLALQLRQSLDESRNFAKIRVTSVESTTGMLPIEGNTMLVFLLELGAPVWNDIGASLYNKLQTLLTSDITAKILWVGEEGRSAEGDADSTFAKPAYRLIDGLSRTLNSETDSEALSILTLSHHSSMSDRLEKIFSVIRKLQSAADETVDTEWVEKDDCLCIPRMVQSASLSEAFVSRVTPRQEHQRAWHDSTQSDGGVPLKLMLGTPGLLNTMKFVEDRAPSAPLAADEVEIKVHAVGLNYRDVLIALGRLQNAHIGCECAGVITQVGSQVQGLKVGDRVAAMAPFGCYRTYLRIDHRLAARIPDGMPFYIAAAMIINHITAWLTLHELGRLQPGETALIHSAAGGTGQAAVQVARHVGAKVLATTGTPEKKTFLTENYGIDPDHIFSSRDSTAFSRGVQRVTNGRGVDLVLNALSGESLVASWECLAPFGRFLEIGKRDIHSRKKLPMARFDDGLSFHAFDVGVLCKFRPNTIRPMLERLFALREEGVLTPASPLQLYGVSQLEKAFRTMQRGQTMGKIVVEMRPEDKVQAVLDARPSTVLEHDATYLIAGGLGGLGRSMAGWLVDRGARYLILLARSGVRTQEAKDFVEDLTRRGVRVAAPPCDISDATALQSALYECSRDMPPIRGAIQATMVLRDAVFMGMTHETWKAATASKVQGSWNMHTLLPTDMDFFIGLSSVSSIAGGRGQANYAAGNSFIDALMHYRVSRGQKGTTLNLGAFLEVGLVTQRADLKVIWEAQRGMTMTEDELYVLLDIYCSGQKVPPQAIFGISGFVGETSTRHYFRKPMLRTLALEASESDRQDQSGSASRQRPHEVDFGSVFATATSMADATAAVNEALLRKLASALALSREDLDPDTPLHTYGVDSLVAVELRNWFAKEVHADLAIFDILGGATTRTASTLATAKTRFKKGCWYKSNGH